MEIQASLSWKSPEKDDMYKIKWDFETRVNMLKTIHTRNSETTGYGSLDNTEYE